jgi:MAP7 domain-containing protein 1
LTVDSVDKLTLDTVYQALAEPEVVGSGEMGRTISKNKDLPEPIVNERRSLSEAYPPASFVVPLMTKSSSVFSNFMRRKKRGEGFYGDEDLPPPTPPKDKGSYDEQTTAHRHIFPQDILHHNLPAVEPMPILGRRRTRSLSEFAAISHSNGSDEVLVESNRTEDAQMPIVPPLPLLTKWKPEVLDPVERAQRRLEAQQRREMEEENALREEAERQVEMKRRKEQLLKEEQEAEARRRASLEDELRRVGAERRRRVLLEQEEEAHRQRGFEERKRLDKERRLQEHKRLEEWRREHARMADEIAQREKESQRQAEDDRRKKIQIAEAKVKRNKHVDSMMTGWVTMQARDSLSWKRRFFKFVGNAVHFYRTPEVRCLSSASIVH